MAQLSLWRDFRSTYAHTTSFHLKRIVDRFLKLALFLPRNTTDMVWTELTWIFCKRRKSEAQLRKHVETNPCFFPLRHFHTYWLCDDFQKITLKCELSWRPSLSLKPSHLSLPLHENLPWSPWLKSHAHGSLGMCCFPHYGALLTTQADGLPVTVTLQPRKHSTVKPVAAITPASIHYTLCQPSDANSSSFLTLLTLLSALWVFEHKLYL